MRVWFLFLSFLFIVPHSSNSQEAKGLFIWSLEDQPAFCNPQKIDRAIDFAHQHKIKTLFVQVYRANQTWFPSKIADSSPYQDCLKKVGQDPLGLLIQEAHQKGIEVHAWLNMLSLSANKEAIILKKYGPTILTRNRKPKKQLEDYKIDHQYFLEPGDSKVRVYSVNIVEELLKAYPQLDGIQFDYIRYPDVNPFYGHSPENRIRFKELTGARTIADNDPRWQQFKRNQVTAFLQALIDKTRAIRPHIHISTTGCLSYSRAMHEAFQEWPLWIKNGMIEFVTLMNYPADVSTFKSNMEGIKLKVSNWSKINVAVGAYKEAQKPKDFKGQLEYCQHSGARSCVLFHYDNFMQRPKFKEVLEAI